MDILIQTFSGLHASESRTAHLGGEKVLKYRMNREYESYRDGVKVGKRTLLNLSHYPPKFVENQKILLKGGKAIERLDRNGKAIIVFSRGFMKKRPKKCANVAQPVEQRFRKP